MEIGRKILNLRKERNLAQRTLAHDAEVTPSALSRIEAGIHTPKGPAVLQLARILGTTADYVLDESAPYPPPARELLANLVDESRSEPREISAVLSEREERLLTSLRSLDVERRRLLEAALTAPRDEVRFTAWVAGAVVPGLDDAERERFRFRARELGDR
ncbi:MAG: helix-turn-helix domain-containing protein [Planctomycetota bacterium]|jgi:transcriptional regulator with XRE-family HTH domain